VTSQQAERYGAELVAEVNAYFDAPPADADGDDRDPKADYARRLAELREKHPRAYEPWTDDEDAELTQLVATGGEVKDIAAKLQRQQTAIRSRIEKLARTPA
jgi:hypothetical protein